MNQLKPNELIKRLFNCQHKYNFIISTLVKLIKCKQCNSFYFLNCFLQKFCLLCLLQTVIKVIIWPGVVKLWHATAFALFISRIQGLLAIIQHDTQMVQFYLFILTKKAIQTHVRLQISWQPASQPAITSYFIKVVFFIGWHLYGEAGPFAEAEAGVRSPWQHQNAEHVCSFIKASATGCCCCSLAMWNTSTPRSMSLSPATAGAAAAAAVEIQHQ